MDAIPKLFDAELGWRRLRRAQAQGAETFLLDRVCADLADRLGAVVRRFESIADIGTPGGAVAHRIAAMAGSDGKAPALLVAMHPLAGWPGPTPAGPQPDGARHAATRDVAGDIAALPFGDAALDLAVSALALQFANDLPGTLVQVRRALRPDGLFLAALAGGDTLTELRQSFAAAEAETTGGVSPRVGPFVDVRVAGHLLQRAGFALPVTDVERLTVRYASLFALIADLRRMAATNMLVERRRQPLRRATLMRAADIYAERFADADGRLRATFDILWLSGWAPHAGQQKPLAPGSAQARLADALGTTERKAGEKAGR